MFIIPFAMSRRFLRIANKKYIGLVLWPRVNLKIVHSFKRVRPISIRLIDNPK